MGAGGEVQVEARDRGVGDAGERRSNCLGSEMDTLWMLAWPGAEETLTSKLVPFFLEPGARVETLKPGLNGRFLPPPAANGEETCALAFWAETIVDASR